MTSDCIQKESIIAGMAVALPVAGQGTESVTDLVTKIKSKDDAVRGPAWQGAGNAGAAAVKPLSDVMMDADFEVARAATRALYLIVRHAGRPGAKAEARAVSDELIALLKSPHALVRKKVAWMLSEVAGNEAVKPIAALLSDPETREDVRCALMRFPGSEATVEFKRALARAPEEFKAALAETLRERGVSVKDYPSQKCVPSRKTEVGA